MLVPGQVAEAELQGYDGRMLGFFDRYFSQVQAGLGLVLCCGLGHWGSLHFVGTYSQINFINSYSKECLL